MYLEDYLVSNFGVESLISVLRRGSTQREALATGVEKNLEQTYPL